MQLPMRLSKTAVTVEKLANVMKTTKRDPQNCPKDMLMNTFGSVTKMRDGPSDGSTPVSYTHLDVYKRQCFLCVFFFFDLK